MTCAGKVALRMVQVILEGANEMKLEQIGIPRWRLRFISKNQKQKQGLKLERQPLCGSVFGGKMIQLYG